jgi:hypothetical protein
MKKSDLVFTKKRNHVEVAAISDLPRVLGGFRCFRSTFLIFSVMSIVVWELGLGFYPFTDLDDSSPFRIGQHQ